MKRTAIASCVLAALATDAAAGGMYLPVRGVRALGRAGAFVAGSEDADSLWLDPAGLAHLVGDGHLTLLADFAYVYQTVDYTRTDSGGNVLPKVTNQQPGQAVPTIAAAYGIGDRLVVAGGIAAPYAALHEYDDDGPQRYNSASLTGSAFVYITAGAAYKVSDKLRVGATVQDVYSKVVSRVVLGGCPGQTVCAPEDPDFDSLSQVEQNDFLSPSGSVGVQYDAHRTVTLGLAVQAPAKVSSTGTIKARLPSSAFFQGARVVGDEGSVVFTLPASIKAGVEIHPTDSLRVEAALDVELWSQHDDLRLEPHGIRIEGAVGVGTYTFSDLVIPRHFKNSYAPSLGVEWHGPNVMIEAGASYETAAAPKDYVSVLTVDSNKLLFGLGGGYESDGWQIGASFAFVKLDDVDVPLADAKVPQLTPLRDQPSQIFVNAGQYKSKYLVGGVRFAKKF